MKDCLDLWLNYAQISNFIWSCQFVCAVTQEKKRKVCPKTIPPPPQGISKQIFSRKIRYWFVLIACTKEGQLCAETFKFGLYLSNIYCFNMSSFFRTSIYFKWFSIPYWYVLFLKVSFVVVNITKFILQHTSHTSLCLEHGARWYACGTRW